MVMPAGSQLPPGLSVRLADAYGKVFGSPPGRTWVRLRALPQKQYAENGGTASGILPVFVSVLKSEVPAREELPREARALAEAIGKVCQRPTENVHILYLPDGKGRIAFGGDLLD